MLVNAGVAKATADMSYDEIQLPCWSIGALWEICRMRKIALEFLTDKDSSKEVIDTLVDAICCDIKTREKSDFNFIK